MTTAQPSAGTSLHSDWTTDLVFARNEAETDATVLAAGSATRTGTAFDVVFGTDADGRYKQYNPSVGYESWTGIAAGPEITILTVLKYASSGAIQAILDSDDGIARNWQFRQTTGGAAEFIGFDSGAGVDVNFASSATISASDDQAVIVRVRNDGGTYKAKVWVGSTATSEVSYSGTPASLTSGEDIGITERLAGGQAMSASKLYFSAIWDAALSDTDCDALAANPWAIYDAKGGGDVTAPVLSSPAFAASSSSAGTASVSTDEGNGTLYCVVTQSATSPSAAQIKAGNDHTGSAADFDASQAVSGTGTQNVAVTGLTASTTYYAHFVHDDSSANESNVATDATGDTTSAPADPPVITGQPSNATVKRGQTATFTVTATGSGTVTYQWQRNPGGVGSWADISGATSASYTTPATTISGGSANDQDDYRCQVSDDDAGPVATDVVTLTVQQCVLALNSAGYEFGDGNAPATMSVVASTELQVAAYPLTEWPPASAIATATATTGTNGRLADLGDDDLVFGTTYRVIARNAADGETWAWTMAAS